MSKRTSGKKTGRLTHASAERWSRGSLSGIKSSLKTLGLTHTRDTLEAILHDAQKEDIGYTDFLRSITDGEIRYRQDKAKEKRIKEAGFPYPKYLNDFDPDFSQALTRKQLRQLGELTWIDGLYNLILAGPPGVGKTHLAIALGYHACENGYKVSYTTMQSLIRVLRTEEIDRRAKTKMKRIRASDLLIIDEVGYLPISPTEGDLFFGLISELQERNFEFVFLGANIDAAKTAETIGIKKQNAMKYKNTGVGIKANFRAVNAMVADYARTGSMESQEWKKEVEEDK